MKIFSIFGSGFGLYGYLPAIAKSYKTILPLKAREIILKRDDIRDLADLVDFSDDLEYILSTIDSCVIATNPLKQEILIDKILQFKNINNIFLEKPLATNPQKAMEIQTKLFANANLNARIAYLFIYCNWFKILELATRESSVISINWQFKAHHYKNNLQTWKRNDKDGGGAINFFGIHLIALCAYLGYEIIEKSSFNKHHNETYGFKATFRKHNRLIISLDSNAKKDIFSIMKNNEVLYTRPSPFETQKMNVDSRINLLEKHLQSNKNSNDKYYDWYSKTLLLWHKLIEQQRK
ncbi:hypothetical protein CCY99_04695 [Helicobacter sp. 16-1353]|uniref:Gfo/Idh/MocA family oxidoreductase n=1 Tax=Helicobacter sp. 16-1353 TaxID=2004996 RepID=UPI000DCBCB48|nr:Gfo/Idh/MocA family oxidoreductase [Helicobacter sp. 16-1353]RAX53987.1 hypothetical protein CCY99_04695 [Helicobacter sp. 16-1353]